jgi:signal transduction histidine kinase/ActR/RegA family two-component response regulator
MQHATSQDVSQLDERSATLIPQRFRSWYRVALIVIGLLSIVSQFIIQYQLVAQESDAQIVNIAGRQRMLSQRISKTMLIVQYSIDSAERNVRLQELQTSLALWEKSHTSLRLGDPELRLPGNNSATIQRMFVELDPTYQTIRTNALAFVNHWQTANDSPAQIAPLVANVLAVEQSFLSGMDAIVAQYTLEARTRVDQLRIIEIALLSITLLVLALEARFIFQPAVRTIQNTLSQLTLVNQQLNTALKETQAANQAKSAFLTTMSHELRTPLTTIIGVTSLLETSNLTDDQRASLGIIRTGGEVLRAHINDILDLAKIEANALELDLHAFDLHRCLDEVMKLMDHQATQQQLTLILEIAPDVPNLVISDSGRIRQIMVNYLSNAIKFTQQGRIHVRIDAKPLQDHHYQLQIAVQDQGIGIAPEHMERLFQPFSQVDATITRNYGGTGLGLAIVKRLSEAMGGRAWAESSPGEGSTFYASFQVKSPLQPMAVPNLIAHRPVVLPPSQSLYILLAEDNDINQRVGRKMLETLGHRVEVANNGLEVLEAVQQTTFDLVLMDIQMPKMDGITATKRIRANLSLNQQPRIVALTGQAFIEDQKACLAAGMNGFLTKPFMLSDLAAIIQQHAKTPTVPNE